jgi:hypothetical protein
MFFFVFVSCFFFFFYIRRIELLNYRHCKKQSKVYRCSIVRGFYGTLRRRDIVGFPVCIKRSALIPQVKEEKIPVFWWKPFLKRPMRAVQIAYRQSSQATWGANKIARNTTTSLFILSTPAGELCEESFHLERDLSERRLLETFAVNGDRWAFYILSSAHF